MLKKLLKFCQAVLPALALLPLAPAAAAAEEITCEEGSMCHLNQVAGSAYDCIVRRLGTVVDRGNGPQCEGVFMVRNHREIDFCHIGEPENVRPWCAWIFGQSDSYCPVNQSYSYVSVDPDKNDPDYLPEPLVSYFDGSTEARTFPRHCRLDSDVPPLGGDLRPQVDELPMLECDHAAGQFLVADPQASSDEVIVGNCRKTDQPAPNGFPPGFAAYNHDIFYQPDGSPMDASCNGGMLLVHDRLFSPDEGQCACPGETHEWVGVAAAAGESPEHRYCRITHEAREELESDPDFPGVMLPHWAEWRRAHEDAHPFYPHLVSREFTPWTGFDSTAECEEIMPLLREYDYERWQGIYDLHKMRWTNALGDVGKGGDNPAAVCARLFVGHHPDSRFGNFNATPLHRTVEPNAVESARMLLLAGADPNLRNSRGVTPLDRADMLNRPDMAALLQEYGATCGARSGPLCGDLEAAAAQDGAPPEADCSADGMRALKEWNAQSRAGYAAGREDSLAELGDRLLNHAAISADVCDLLRRGADPNFRDRRNQAAPLHKTVDPDALDSAELLLMAGADPNARNKRGLTPLDRAVKLKRPEMAELLREFGGECNVHAGHEYCGQ